MRPECTHDAEQLVDFLIPRLDLRDLSLQEALAQILDEYSRICVETGETPGRFAYTLNAEPVGPINLHLRQISLLSALRLVAIQAGLDLSREGFALTFDAPARDPDAPLLTIAYPVTPDVVDLLHRLVDPEATPDVGDPFAAEPPPTPPELLTLLDTLGAVRAGGAAASFLSNRLRDRKVNVETACTRRSRFGAAAGAGSERWPYRQESADIHSIALSPARDRIPRPPWPRDSGHCWV